MNVVMNVVLRVVIRWNAYFKLLRGFCFEKTDRWTLVIVESLSRLKTIVKK